MKSIHYLLLWAALLVSGAVCAQDIRLSGKVMDVTRKEPAAFANIVLQTTDSVFVAGTAADARGDFRLDKLSPGDYRLLVSAIGYRTHAVNLQGLSRSVSLGEIALEEETQQLNEVTVSAANVVNSADRKLVFPSKQQVQASTNGVDLLRNLMLPRLRINPMNEEVSLSDGSTVQLCINGRKTDRTEIKSLQPADIIRVEYLEDPGLRYGDAGAVVNYVVRRHETGGSGNLDVSQSPHVWWGNQNASFKLNHKKSEFSVRYYGYQHVFGNTWRTRQEHFLMEDGTTLTRTEEGIPTKSEEYASGVSAVYNLQETDDYMFNASLSWSDYNTPKRNFHSRLHTLGSSEASTLRMDDSRKRFSRPSLDLYFQKTLKNKQFMALNVVGTYMNTDNGQTYREWMGDELLADYFSEVDGKKYSLIGEGIYEKQFKTGSLSAGVRHTQAYSDNLYTGTLQYGTQMKQADTYAYMQYKGKAGRLGYSAGMGMTRSWLHQVGQEDYETYKVNPRFSLSYTFSNAFYMRLNANMNSNQPSLGQLSAVDQLVDSLQINRGNPSLKPYDSYYAGLSMGYSKGKVNLNLKSGYWDMDHVIMEETYREQGKFVHSYANQDRYQAWETELTARVGMLWNVLQLSATTGLNRYWSDGRNYYHTYSNWYYEGEVNVMYKRWMGYFMIQSNRNRFMGESQTSGENLHLLMLRYRLGKANVGLAVINPFSDNYKREEDNRNRYASYRGAMHIKESARMFFATFSWNFQFGRKYQSEGKRLSNSDTDAGVI